MKKILFLIALVIFSTVSYAQYPNSNPPDFIDNVYDTYAETSNKKVTLSVYPNPSQGNFTLDIANFNREKTSIMIFDKNGRMIDYRYIDNIKQSSIVQYNLNGLSKGMYIIKVSCGKKSKTIKFLISA